MGLAHSGAIAEADFLAGGETGLIDKRQQYGVHAYMRFKDDVFVLFEDASLLTAFLTKLRQGHPFIIKCEAISSYEIQIWDVLVQKSIGCFRTSPYTKPSSLATPMLSRYSAHHPSVHHSWHAGLLRQRKNLCSTRERMIMHATQFTERAKLQHLSAKAVYVLESMVTANSNGTSSQNRGYSERPGHKRYVVLRCVLPFYQCCHVAGLGSRLASFFKSEWARRQLQTIFPEVPSVSVSWPNAVPNLMKLLRKSCGGVQSKL